MKYCVEGVERLLVVASLLVLLVAAGPAVRADDTEIYQADYQSGTSGRPKVLIIFDNSGSMDTVVQEGGERPEYDPNGTYVQRFNSDRIYWSDDQYPPSSNSSQYFSTSSNRCASSVTPLSTVGKFTSKAQLWRPSDGYWHESSGWECTRYKKGRCRDWEWVETRYWSGDEAEWRALSTSDRSPMHVDCAADVIDPGNAGNGPGQDDGYPYQPSDPAASNSQAYTDNRGTSNVDWGNTTYTFYSAHYMDWLYDDTILSEEKTRMQIAQEVVNSLINSNPIIDFGLAVFNYNNGNSSSSNNGGRIVKRIIPSMSDAQRTTLTNVVSSLSPDTWTPLCESTYEVYRYLSGQSLVYGNKKRSSDSPDRDYAAESGGKYAPPTSDCAYTYVILMTDGYPTYDSYANSAIESLTGKTCGRYEIDSNGNTDKNCLPTLTEYMANRDLDGVASNGNQFGITYTIGFTQRQELLRDAATKGKGRYYQAENSAELTAAFQGAVLSILSTDSTFTAPAVAVDTFTRVQSRNEVFFAMFKPDDSQNWPGNIKRLDISFDTGDAVLEDSNGDPAIDASTGLIKDNATTVWSTEVDGANVGKGGVGGLLATTNLSARANRLWTNTGTDEALELFSSANIDTAAYGFDITEPEDQLALLYSVWGVSDQAELNEVIRWGVGYDTEDEDEDDSTNDNRPWLLGDILHSKPHIVNYGALGSFTNENPDIRILVGTNAGFLHMFGNSDGEEDWAFFAKELGSVLTRRKDNVVSSERVYGIDSPVVVATEDLNLDGTIDHTAGDSARVYFGLRRGGRQLYALDISDPDTPSFLWRISDEEDGFEELGQTWSVPKVVRIPGYVDDEGYHKPVLVFGAGYDPVKDDHDTLAVSNSDRMGRGIFFVDAVTGEKVWSVTPASNSNKNLQETGLIHSVPAAVTPLDSNGDGVADRIYFGDTGGNLWRIDMPLDALPTSSQNTWRIVKMFAANGGTRSTDRRFFSAPDVVRTTADNAPVDAILIGTGDRTNPAEKDDATDETRVAVDNQFYMIRDKQINPYFSALDSSVCVSEPEQDFRCGLPMTPAGLYDATDNLLQEGTAAQKAAAAEGLSEASGWLINLLADGEKSLAESLTIDGKVYFTTFSPDAQSTNICEPTPGTGRLYNVSLQGATSVMDFDGDGNYDRFLMVGGLIPDTPSAHFGEDGEIRLLLPPGVSTTNVVGNPLRTNSQIPAPYGSYWHMDTD
ncbi:MAG: hypothetical protein KDI17_08245 [Halioglobus sp.]|nr:hypothetical protein [Halioglobus sp.]